MKEYWVNVYEYKTVKNTQFYSHRIPEKGDAEYRAMKRKEARPDCKCLYRIHVKMKSRDALIQRIRLPNNYIVKEGFIKNTIDDKS